MTSGSPIQTKLQLSVIVLFYLGEKWIDSCLESLENQSLARNAYEIILVDNGGSTPSVEKYNGEPHVKVLRFDRNYGFTGGNNRALRHAAAELVVLMNQDVVVHHRCLQEMLAAFAYHPQAGIICANMLMVSQKDPIDPWGPRPNFAGYYDLVRWGYAAYDVLQTDAELLPVDTVSGNAMGFRKALLADVGDYLFDERLGSYAEDLDLSLRLQETSWQMGVATKAIIFHYRDEAFSGGPLHRLRKLFHVSGNRLLVHYKNNSLQRFFLKLPELALGIPLKVSRTDGDPSFKILYFGTACCLLPLILGYFVVKLCRFTSQKISK